MEAAITADVRLNVVESDAVDSRMSKSDGRMIRGERRREAVLAAARKLFVRDGYRRTTLESIIALAGGSREMIYSALGGKRGLVRAIIAEVGEQLATRMEDPKVLHLPPREGLSQFGNQLVHIWRTDEGRAMGRMVVSEGLDAPELIKAWYEGGPQLSIEALAHYLEIQHRAETLVVPDARMAARQFLILLIGESAYPMLSGTPNPVDADAAVKVTVDFFLRAHARK